MYFRKILLRRWACQPWDSLAVSPDAKRSMMKILSSSFTRPQTKYSALTGCFTVPAKSSQPTLKKQNRHQLSQRPAPVDVSSAINAAISAYVELTNRLKQEMAERLADKETIIDEKNKRIVALEREVAAKDVLITELQRKVASLESELSQKQKNDTTSLFSFNPGVADNTELTK